MDREWLLAAVAYEVKKPYFLETSCFVQLWSPNSVLRVKGQWQAPQQNGW